MAARRQQNDVDDARQVADMNRRDNVVTLADNGERGQVRMQRHPGTSEELVEDIVLLAVTIHETGTDDMNGKAAIFLLLKSKCILL